MVSDSSATRFARALKSLVETPEEIAVNVTFVLGSGFSNSWDKRYPIGNDLFDFSSDEWAERSPILANFLESVSLCPKDLRIDRSMFLDLVYQVGMLRKYPPIRHRYVDDYGLEIVERELRYLVYRKFRDCIRHSPIKDCAPALPDPLDDAQHAILAFFARLLSWDRPAHGHDAGDCIRLNFLTTNYDYLVEALVARADLCNASTQARRYYRGFTPAALSGSGDVQRAMPIASTGHLLKINGGFEIFRTREHFELDYRERDEARLRANPPQIMLPSRAQDYEQAYFQALFPKAVRLLQESRVAVLIGYGFPEEDALLRLLLRQFAEAPRDGRRRALYYIDLETEKTQLARVTRVFPHASDSGGLAVMPYQGSFSDWCDAVLQQI
ncbi:SIR2 family protein [Trinickia caryophylli]|uniref:SIR2-like domain-containing protein n=1 Tax=Trinickia caryophylli TaxID=28094 RepID=A0A1X7FK49_TRICW|nr:SIR2 family protein [Trinickia caryophylli]WQE13385.1 SIR2 family protein [Trinickia caryophylli]GLU34096.1 hypothetical protein Busp01_39380 [Trinickia caryophylli]SMF53639.1 SIR2-like domain-containing protein [Trinickia caryophylli]